MGAIGIYRFWHLESGKTYVGSSINIESRKRHHLHRLRHGAHHSILFQRAWDKYGESAFAFEVLETVTSLTDLLPAEQRWIDHYQATDSEQGYNVYPIARRRDCYVVSAETRLRLSIHAKARHASPETRARMSAALRGKTRSAETRARMSDAQKVARSRVSPEERSALARKGALAMWARPNARELQSLARKGTKRSPESITKAAIKVRGVLNPSAKLTEEQVLAIRESLSQGAAQRALARQYDVSRMTIRRIARGTHWRHI